MTVDLRDLSLAAAAVREALGLCRILKAAITGKSGVMR